MPLDVLGRTRATLTKSISRRPAPIGAGNLANFVVLGIDPCNSWSRTRNS